MSHQELIDFGLFKLDDQINYFTAFLLDRREELIKLSKMASAKKQRNDYHVLKGKIIAYEEILEAFGHIMRILDTREGAENEAK